MVRTSVVLPAPFAPSTAVILPSRTDSETCSRAMTPPYATVRSLISSMRDRLPEVRVGDIAVGADLGRRVPDAITCPRLSTVMVSLTAMTMSTWCSTSAIAIRVRRDRNRSISSLTSLAESPLAGSSRSSRDGRAIKARAMMTRFWTPCGRAPG